MTVQQATAELERLFEGLGGNIKGITGEERRSWMRVLEALPYERGRSAVTWLIDNHVYNSFPRPGALNRAAEKVSQEGQPNAVAYSQNSAPAPENRKRMQRQIEQHERWLDMDDAEYFAEVQRLRSSGAIRITGG